MIVLSQKCFLCIGGCLQTFAPIQAIYDSCHWSITGIEFAKTILTYKLFFLDFPYSGRPWREAFRLYDSKSQNRATYFFLNKTWSLSSNLKPYVRKLMGAIRHPISDIRHPTSEIRHPTSDIPDLTPDIRHPRFDIRHPTSEIRHPTFERLAVMCTAWDQGTYEVRFERKQCGLFWFCLIFLSFCIVANAY